VGPNVGYISKEFLAEMMGVELYKLKKKAIE
jgi:hypothetical protein